MFDFTLIPYWPWALVAAAITGLLAGVITRLVQRQSALVVVGESFETTLYAALGCMGGLLAGLFFSYVFPPGLYGTIAIALGLVSIAGIVLGFLYGNAHVAYKLLGLIAYLLIAAAFVAGGILAWASGYSSGYVGWFSAVLALTGTLSGILFGLYRSAHWSVGWLLVAVNGSWGALGNLTGLLLHVGSWLFFSGQSSAQPRPRRVFAGSQRRFFHCWENGMRILPDYFFSQGAVMTAWSQHGMWHEAVHVVQHYIFGPLMLVSYVCWAVIMAVVGGIVGLATGNGFMHGAFAYAYVNNPWEVWEYQSSWGSSSPTPRRVTSAVVAAGKQNTDLIFSTPLAWTLTVVWIALWSVGFVLWVVFAGQPARG